MTRPFHLNSEHCHSEQTNNHSLHCTSCCIINLDKVATAWQGAIQSTIKQQKGCVRYCLCSVSRNKLSFELCTISTPLVITTYGVRQLLMEAHDQHRGPELASRRSVCLSGSHNGFCHWSADWPSFVAGVTSRQ